MSKRYEHNSFLGTGWNFPPSFVKHGGGMQANMLSDEEDIYQSLLILLRTSPGERVMNPTYGCGLRDMLFEGIDESAITEIKDIIERAILFFEPRITLQRIDVQTDEVLEGRVDIQLFYTVRTTNTRSNIVYPFYFREGSLVSM